MLKKNILLLCFLAFATYAVIAQNTNVKSDKDVVPQALEDLYDDLLTSWKQGLKYNDDCTSNSDQAVSVSDSVYIQRLFALPTEMELAFNPIVRNYIEMYASRRRSQVSYMLGEGEYFFPMFENILDKEGIPLELKYLPVIESALNPIARSRVGATGLWQFMAGTGKMYKLEINTLVDERRDPVKATEAAAKYLKDMYRIYGDWNLVIAAYNCGPGNVNKAIRRSGGKRDYWEIYPYLPRETRGYVPAFIAATYIMNYYNEHNICPSVGTRPSTLDTLQITKNVHFEQITNVLGLSVDDVRRYNPEFKSDIIPGEYKPYALRLPIREVGNYISQESQILAYRSSELLTHRKTVDVEVATLGASTDVVHRVKKGDTLSGIASKYGVSAAQVRSWNSLKSDRLTIGRRLSVYRKVKQATPKAIIEKQSDPLETKEVVTTLHHRIKKGDTWSSIASKHSVSVVQLKQWNKASKTLVAGKDLTVLQTKLVTLDPKPIVLNKPELMVVKLDSAYIAKLVANYLNNIERDASSMPTLSILGSDDSQDKGVVSTSSRMFYHKVKAGDTLFEIASRYKVSKDEIIEWNKLSNATPRIGQRLLIYLPEKAKKIVSTQAQPVHDGMSASNN